MDIHTLDDKLLEQCQNLVDDHVYTDKLDSKQLDTELEKLGVTNLHINFVMCSYSCFCEYQNKDCWFTV